MITPVRTEQPSNGIRFERLLPLVLVVLVMLVALLTVTPWPVGAYHDDAIYTMLAKALATGEGYRMINLPGSPHATHYPPGYPFFLSLLWRLSPSFPDNIVLFKFANAAWLAAAALGAWAFARSRLHWSPLGSALAAAAGTLSIVVLLVTGVVLSEPMFMALLFPALLLSERAAEAGTTRYALAAGLACGVLALVRTLGGAVLPAALLVMLLRRHFRGAVVMAASAAVLLVPWQLWMSAWQHEIPPVLMGKYGAYGPWLAQGVQEGGMPFMRDIVVANVKSIHGFTGYLFMPVRWAWPHVLATTGVGILVAIGMAVFAKRSPVTSLFLSAYAAVVLLWPFDPDRFVLGIWPLLTLCGLAGLVAIWRWAPSHASSRALRWVALSSAAALVAGFAAFNGRGYRHQFWASMQRDAGRRAKPVVEWVALRTDTSDVLMTDDDLLVYLYTGRRGMPTSTFLPIDRLRPPSDSDNIAAVRAMIDEYAPRYYITTSQPGQRAAEALTLGSAPLLRRYRLIPNAYVYERITTP